MTVRISGTNTTAAPGFQGGDSDTGIRPGTNEIEFVTGGSVAATFNSSGNLVFPDTQGIDFSAASDSQGSSTSSILDDYEEGTFTPIIETAGSEFTYTTQQGFYTKIGNMVYIRFNITVDTVTNTGGSSIFRMGQLPFQSTGTSRFNVTTSGVNFDATAFQFYGYLASNDQLRIIYNYDNSGQVAALGNTFTFGSGDGVIVAGWYMIQ